MGLDQYLMKRIGIYAMYEFEEIGGSVALTKSGEDIPINLNKVQYIIEQSAYWRKANAIHKWFVDNVQDGNDDCKEYYVSKEQLQELVKTCKEVLNDHSKASELLPTQDGFFFGGTEYNDYYFECLKDTVTQIEEALKQEYPKGVYVSFYYDSSW